MISHKFCLSTTSHLDEWLRCQPVKQKVVGSNPTQFQFFFFFCISKMDIEIVWASISIQFDSIQSIVSKFRCIDPTLVMMQPCVLINTTGLAIKIYVSQKVLLLRLVHLSECILHVLCSLLLKYVSNRTRYVSVCSDLIARAPFKKVTKSNL